MKIMHILPNLHIGGGQKLVVDLCNELSKNDSNDVYICVIDKIDDTLILKEQISSKITIISLNKEKGFSVRIIFKIYLLLKDFKPDLVHTHLRSIFYAFLAISSLEIPFVHTFHSVANKEADNFVKKIYYQILFKYLHVTPVSISPLVLEGTKVFFGKKYNILINNGVMPLTKSFLYEKVREEIEELKNTRNTKVFIVIGRLSEEKNQLMLINVVKELQNEGEDLLLLIVGPLTQIYPYAEECQNTAKNIKCVHFLDEKSNVGDYLYNSDALCIPSLREGLPLTALEAMSINKPVLATPVGGLPDIIQDGMNGYLSEDVSLESYKKIVKKFISKPLKVDKKNKEIFEKKYSISACMEQYYKLYKSLII